MSQLYSTTANEEEEDREGFESREGDGPNNEQVSELPGRIRSKVCQTRRRKMGKRTRNRRQEEERGERT